MPLDPWRIVYCYFSRCELFFSIYSCQIKYITEFQVCRNDIFYLHCQYQYIPFGWLTRLNNKKKSYFRYNDHDTIRLGENIYIYILGTRKILNMEYFTPRFIASSSTDGYNNWYFLHLDNLCRLAIMSTYCYHQFLYKIDDDDIIWCE